MEHKTENTLHCSAIERLYPVNTRDVAIAAANLEDILDFKGITTTYSGMVIEDKNTKTHTLYAHHFNLNYRFRVLPNGSVLRESKSSKWLGQEWQDSYGLELVYLNASHSIPFKEMLDPYLASILLNNNEEMRLVCGSLDKKNIYLYQCKYVKQERYMLYGNSRNPIIENKPRAILENDLGILLYSTQEDSIRSLASSSTEKNQFIAIACESGEIKYAKLIDNKLSDWIVIADPVENTTVTTEILSTQGLLIAHIPNQNLMHIVNMETGFTSVCIDMDLFNPTISASGKYISALVKQEGETSDKAWIYEFATKSFQILNLAKPVSDFVIGFKDIVCYAQGNQLIYSNTIASFLYPKGKGNNIGFLASNSSKTKSETNQGDECVCRIL